jgi:hypothetical protein
MRTIAANKVAEAAGRRRGEPTIKQMANLRSCVDRVVWFAAFSIDETDRTPDIEELLDFMLNKASRSKINCSLAEMNKLMHFRGGITERISCDELQD